MEQTNNQKTERLKLISDKIIRNGKIIVYNRRIIKYDSERDKSQEQKYKEQNIEQFYDFINPNLN